MANNETKIIISAQDQTKSAIDSVKANLNSIKAAGSSLSSSFATLGAFGVAGYTVMDFVQKTRATLDNAEAINKLSQKTGIATDTLSGFSVAAKLADVSDEALGSGLKKLAVNMAAAGGGAKEQSELFKAMGIDVKDSVGNLRGTDDVMRQIADKFASYKDGPGKAALAVALFGKSGDALIPLLNALRETESEAKKLGAVFGPDFASRAEEFNDNLKKMGIAAEGFRIVLIEPMLEGMKEITKEMVRNTEQGNRWGAMILGLTQTLGFMDTIKLKYQKELSGIPDQIAAIEANIDRLQKKFGNHPTNVTTIDGLRGQIKALIARGKNIATYLDEYESDTPRQANGDKKTPPVVTKTPDTTAAELALQKRLIAARQQLEEKKRALFGESEQETMQRRLESGTFMEFNTPAMNEAGVPAEFMNRAAEIDQRKQLLDIIKIEGENRKPLYEAMQKEAQIQKDAWATGELEKETMVFQLGLIGKTSIEQEKMNATRRVDLELRRQLETLAVTFNDDMSSYDAGASALRENANKMKRQLEEGISARVAAERSWETGTRSAFNDYIDNAGNAAEQSKNLFTNAFKGMEDTLTNFAMTGKMDFKSLTNSIISDMVRMNVQASITKPLAQMVSGFFTGGSMTTNLGEGGADFFTSTSVKPLGNFFTGGSMTSNLGEGGADFFTGGSMTSKLGEGGADFFTSTSVKPLGSYATGTDYVPRTGLYMLHQGEKVTPAAQNGAPNVVVNVVPPPGQPMGATTTGPTFDGERWVIGVVLNAMENNPNFRNGMGR